MVYLYFVLRIVLALVFLSSGTAKVLDMDKFQSSMMAYRLLPDRILFPLSYGIVLAEIIGGLGLLAGVGIVFPVVLLAALLLMFNGALSVNLLRGNRNIDCGCGGVLEVQQINWWLVVRNFLLIGILYLLTTEAAFTPSFLEAMTIIGVVIAVLCSYSIVMAMRAAQSHVAAIDRSRQDFLEENQFQH